MASHSALTVPATKAVLPPILIADDPALDLVNSRASPGGRDMEWLGDAESLASWMSAAGLEEAAGQTAALSPAQRQDVLGRVVRLREWLRAFVARRAGAPLREVDPDALDLLNGELVQDDSYDQVIASGGRIRVCGPVHRRTEEAIVQPLVGAVVAFLCSADFTRVRQCEGADCTLWFLDRTKAGTRRWCSMAMCGNRAKARAHRARR